MNESPGHMVKMTAKAKYDKTTFSKIGRWQQSLKLYYASTVLKTIIPFFPAFL